MKYRCAILDDYPGIALNVADWSALETTVELVTFRHPFSDQGDIIRQLKDFDILILMRERTPISRPVIESLPKLKLIVTTGGRNDSLDVAAACERHIVCCGTRGSGTSTPTAQITAGLMLELARRIGFETAQLATGKWQTTVGIDLEGKTLGIIGLGRLGGRMAKIGAAFGMKVLAWSQNLTAENAALGGAAFVSKDELFAQSDVVSVHLTLSERTRQIIGAADISRMKPSAFLINTARDGLIDQHALVSALREKKIAGAGLDVFDCEPLPADHPLRQLSNVVLTPHLGYVTWEYLGTNYADAIEDILAWHRGTPVRMLAKPAVANASRTH